jgi:hypothetical protein
VRSQKPLGKRLFPDTTSTLPLACRIYLSRGVFALIWIPSGAIPSDTRGILPDTVALDLSVFGDISRLLPGKYIQATSGYRVSPLQ